MAMTAEMTACIRVKFRKQTRRGRDGGENMVTKATSNQGGTCSNQGKGGRTAINHVAEEINSH